MGFQNDFVVPLVGWKGEMALLWLSSKRVDLVSYSHHHICAQISSHGSLVQWWLTRFYGYSKTHRRQASWELLSKINPSNG